MSLCLDDKEYKLRSPSRDPSFRASLVYVCVCVCFDSSRLLRWLLPMASITVLGSWGSIVGGGDKSRQVELRKCHTVT